MAGNAVRIIIDPFILVFLGDFALVMAGIAGIAIQAVAMAITAGVRPTMTGWEGVGTVVLSRRPPFGAVTATTVQSEHSLMVSWFRMAGAAVRRCALKNVVLMARSTAHPGVCAS